MIEDILGKAKKAADAAGKKTGELVEISKLKLSAMQVNTDIKALYEKLGGAVYSMKKANYDNPELIDSLTEEIDEKRAELKEINNKIAVLQKAKECSCCQTKNPRDAFYCSKCGSRLPVNKQDNCCGDYCCEGCDTEENE